MPHKKYDVEVSMSQGGNVKTRTIEVHADNDQGGKPYVAGTD